METNLHNARDRPKHGLPGLTNDLGNSKYVYDLLEFAISRI